MRTVPTLVLAAALLSGLAAHAQPAVVEAVQYPAWLERGGHAVPLAPGVRLQARDRLRTGANARVRLKLAEGSAVKLGENARFVIERAESRGLFRAALAVVAGAFRFTTEALSTRKRDVAIKVQHVTVGVRGTDLWGKAAADRDFVVLLEGRITVGSEGHPQVTLDKPLDAYEKPASADPAVKPMDAKTVQALALETEMSEDGAAAEAGGRWRALSAGVAGRDAALALQRRVRAAGYPAEIVADAGAFAVQVAGLASERAARAAAAALRAIPGAGEPSVRQAP